MTRFQFKSEDAADRSAGNWTGEKREGSENCAMAPLDRALVGSSSSWNYIGAEYGLLSRDVSSREGGGGGGGDLEPRSEREREREERGAQRAGCTTEPHTQHSNSRPLRTRKPSTALPHFCRSHSPQLVFLRPPRQPARSCSTVLSFGL
ncbi:hypothetical protein J6590_055264 [Homalodisca vitripennis]|nr:hypothetical protein J6590_055264 [Homalodisca vitripennis]